MALSKRFVKNWHIYLINEFTYFKIFLLVEKWKQIFQISLLLLFHLLHIFAMLPSLLEDGRNFEENWQHHIILSVWSLPVWKIFLRQDMFFFEKYKTFWKFQLEYQLKNFKFKNYLNRERALIWTNSYAFSYKTAFLAK